MYLINILIAITETTNATNIPSIKMKNWKKLNAKPNFLSFNKLAPNITGIDIKNENSAAKLLESPRISAPIIVAPDLGIALLIREWPGSN